MGAVSQIPVLIDYAMLRSILPRDRPMRIPDPHRRRRPGHWSAARAFVGHLAITVCMFVALVAFSGSVAVLLSIAEWTHAFSADALRVFGRLEIVLIRADAVACLIVLMYGIGRFILKVIRGDS